MRYLTIILLTSSALKSQQLWQFFPDTIMRWNYYDGDEFNNHIVNKEKWNVGFPWGRSILSQETVVKDSNIAFDKGIISFILKKEMDMNLLQPWEIDTISLKKNKIKLFDGNKWESKYSGSLLWSNRAYKYGYFEIKFKAPDGLGIWPAFWLYGAKPNNEIDFFELKGEKEKELHVDIHCPDGCGNFKEGPLGYKKGWGHWVSTNQKLKDGFNILAGEWTSGFIKWYLNGELIAYSNHSFDLGMNLIVGTGLARDGAAFKPGPNKTTLFPNSFYVDYIRIFKNDTLPNVEKIRSNFSLKPDTINYTDLNNLVAGKARKKLNHNPDSKIRQTEVLTLSVIQITKNALSLRVIGVKGSDKIQINFVDEKNRAIKSFKVNKNLERVILLNGNKTLNMHVETGSQVLNEKITLQ
jgi:beta-glucanase (GH16 family)